MTFCDEGRHQGINVVQLSAGECLLLLQRVVTCIMEC